jgi:hypothetical protein
MKATIRALILGLWAGPLAAQVLQPREPSWTDKWNFGIGLFGGFAVGDFREADKGGGGVDVMLGFQPFRREPLSIRGNVVFLDYGGLRQRGYQEVCDQFGSCFLEEVEFDARNHTAMFFQIGPEFMVTDGKWRPFGFALLGTTVFNSTMVLPESQTTEGDAIFTSNNFSTAYGVGLRRVGTRWGRETGFELSGRFTRNGKASYLTEGGITQNSDGSFTITPREGAANIVGIHIGFWVGPYINWNERR